MYVILWNTKCVCGGNEICLRAYVLFLWSSAYVLFLWSSAYVLFLWSSAYVLFLWSSAYVLFLWSSAYVLFLWSSACVLFLWSSETIDLGPLITDVQSALFTAFCRRIFTFVSLISFLASSNHLSLGLPILLPPTSLLSNIVLTTLSWSIFTVCLTRSNILDSISTTISNSLYIRNFLVILVSLSRFRRESKFVYLCAFWPSINTLQVVVSFKSTVTVNVINKCFIVSINKMRMLPDYEKGAEILG